MTLQLAPSIKSCKIWCQARGLLLPVPQAGKNPVSKLIQYFASHPTDNITLSPSDKRTNESLSEFKTGIGAAAYATLDTQQIIYHTIPFLVDTVASLKGSDGGGSVQTTY